MQYKTLYIASYALAISSAITLYYFMYTTSGNSRFEETYWLMGALACFTAVISSSLLIARFLRNRSRKIRKRIFIIYSRDDLEIAQQISQVLASSGYEPWLDVDSIKPGQIIKDAIDEALSTSTLAIFIASKSSIGSAWVRNELQAVLYHMLVTRRGTSPVIPIKIDSSQMPDSLSDIQYVDIREVGWKDRLLSGLEQLVM